MCILIKFSAVALALTLAHSISFSLSLSFSLYFSLYFSLSVLPFLVGLLPVSQATLGLKGAHRISSIRTATAAHTRSPYRPPLSCCHKSLELPQNQGGHGEGGVVIMCNCAKCFSNVQNAGQKIKRNFSCSPSKDKQRKARERRGGGSNQR